MATAFSESEEMLMLSKPSLRGAASHMSNSLLANGAPGRKRHRWASREAETSGSELSQYVRSLVPTPSPQSSPRSAAPVAVWIMELGSKKFEQRVSRFLRPFLQDPMTGVRKNDYRHIVRDQLHLRSELVA